MTGETWWWVKKKFGEDNAVDLATNDDIGMCGGRKGEMEITKVDGDWTEGKFFLQPAAGNQTKLLRLRKGFSAYHLQKII